MPLRPDDEPDDDLLGIHTVEYGRYAEVRLDEDGVIVYDTENEDAWIQAESAVEIAERV